jgi:hypothetical protein
MTNQLPATLKHVGALVRIGRAISSFAISQVEAISFRYTEHHARIASVDARKEIVVAEGKALAEVKAKILDRMTSAPIEDRHQLRHQLEEIDADLRRIDIYGRASEHIAHLPSSQQVDTEDTAPEISESWLDRFNSMAKAKNEPWRQALLARALAEEALQPGSLNTRALWLIGTLDEGTFNALATLLDVAPVINGGPVIPNGMNYMEREVGPHGQVAKVRLGSMLFKLTDLGLLGDLHTSKRAVWADATVGIHYGGKNYIITTRNHLEIPGLIFTEVAAQLARLRDPQPSALGNEIVRNWLDELKQRGVIVVAI